MNSFEKAIKKQIILCRALDKFKSTVFLNKGKEKFVEKITKYIVSNIPGNEIDRWHFNESDGFIELTNGSNFRIVTINEGRRGLRMNGCIIDEDIPKEIQRLVVLPHVMTRVTLEDGCLHESWGVVKSRISVVKIEWTE